MATVNKLSWLSNFLNTDYSFHNIMCYLRCDTYEVLNELDKVTSKCKLGGNHGVFLRRKEDDVIARLVLSTCKNASCHLKAKIAY